MFPETRPFIQGVLRGAYIADKDLAASIAFARHVEKILLMGLMQEHELRRPANSARAKHIRAQHLGRRARGRYELGILANLPGMHAHDSRANAAPPRVGRALTMPSPRLLLPTPNLNSSSSAIAGGARRSLHASLDQNAVSPLAMPTLALASTSFRALPATLSWPTPAAANAPNAAAATSTPTASDATASPVSAPVFAGALDVQWRTFATDALLGASATLDRCMKVLPVLQRVFSVHEHEGADASLLLRDVALTMAALERALCAFATQQFAEAHEWEESKQRRAEVNAPASRVSSNGSLASIVSTSTSSTASHSITASPAHVPSSASTATAAAATSHSRHDWRYCGGLVPYLLLLRRLLSEVHATLAQLSRASSLTRIAARHPRCAAAAAATPLALVALASTRVGEGIGAGVGARIVACLLWGARGTSTAAAWTARALTALVAWWSPAHAASTTSAAAAASASVLGDVTSLGARALASVAAQLDSISMTTTSTTPPTVAVAMCAALARGARAVTDALWRRRSVVFRAVLATAGAAWLAHQVQIAHVDGTLSKILAST